MTKRTFNIEILRIAAAWRKDAQRFRQLGDMAEYNASKAHARHVLSMLI